ncbi:MAG: hypothetical protein QOF41_2760 [Methylobacteriaceae bacterium]|nr:hypothetical protein [Methylobacteriaceae bacterium]
MLTAKTWTNIAWASLGLLGALEILSWQTAAYGQICYETGQTADQECAAYGIPLFVFIKIGKALEDHNAAVTAFFTVVLAISTIALWRSTDKLWLAAVAQGRDMENSIAEAARSASAMENVASHIEANNRVATENIKLGAQIALENRRAYLAVDFNGGFYQESGLSFGITPSLMNVGVTPAYKVDYWAIADIVPWPIPEDFVFRTGDEIKFGAVLNPRQGFGLNARVDRLVPDEEVEPIMRGMEKRVVIWGKVTFEDISGTPRYVKFCHSIYWIKTSQGERALSQWAPRHNEAT